MFTPSLLSTLYYLSLLYSDSTVASAASPPHEAATEAAGLHCYLRITARQGDTCASVAAVFNMSVDDFLHMNPGVAIDCAGLVAGRTYCVAAVDDDNNSSSSSAGGATPPPTQPPTATPTEPPTPTSTSTPAAWPSPPADLQQPGITPRCRRWYLVKEGDDCIKVELSQGVSDADFRAWNGFLDAACSNLWLGYYCCVGV